MPHPSLFTTVISGYLPEPHASLLNGILFGIPLKSAKDLHYELQRVGLLHLVVLSGVNITLLASFVKIICAHFSRILSYLIVILVIILFVLFVGPQAPIVRTAIMTMCTYVGIMMGRRNLSLYSLIISFCVILLIFPRWFSSISLYLSYGATLGIILFAGKREEGVVGELKTSLAAQVFTVPIILFSFKQVSLISPLANILVGFTVGPLMIFGFLAALLGKVHYELGIIPIYLCYGILSYMLYVITILSRIPFTFFQF